MLNTPTRSNAKRFALAERRFEVEEKLPVSDEARVGLSSLWVGLVGAFAIAAVLIVLQMVG
jgi:hypothetical protein